MARRPKKNLYHIILVNHDKMKEDLFWTDSEATVNKELKEKFSKILQNKKLTKSIDFTIDFFTETAIEKITSEINADTIKEEN